jgi:hypothetical protein
MSEKQIKYESIKQLVKALYEGWKSMPEYINDVKTLNETEFNTKLHHGLGQQLRNAYIHKRNTSIYNECAFLGYVEPDDCSWYITNELYKYTKIKLGISEETEKQIEGIDYDELLGLYPKAMQELKAWFASCNGVNNPTKVIVHNNTVILITDTFNVTLNIRDLYYFFDTLKMRVFVVPHVYPKCFFVFQSPKNQKDYDTIYDDRESAEIGMFKEAFRIAEKFLSIEA